MSRFIQWSNPIRLQKLTHIMKIRGVDVYVHWTVFLIAAFMILGAIQRPALTIVGLICYLSVFLIHETGHLLTAHRRRSEVFSVKLYPIFGITSFESPWTRLDHCIIAWGGVLAQAVIAIPLVLWVKVFGFTPFEPLNAVFAILGFFSLGVALFNLLPIPPLDGATAWGLFPALIERARKGKRKTSTDWRR
jgi:membrane-associated protease RseP (regulator of RpoE activity)